MKLHRKKKHNEKVCRAHDLGSYAQGQGRNQVKGQNLVSAITQNLVSAITQKQQICLSNNSKSCLSNNSKTANLTKLHRKIEHNEKVCCALELVSYVQGQGHNQVRGQIVPKIVLLIN